jgi:alkylation response protein AidB-like acyl-CoA dehydrogenase
LKRPDLHRRARRLRETVRTFLTKEVLPHYEQWEKGGIVSRGAWPAAGRQGLLGIAVPEEDGGGGTTISGTPPCSPRSSPYGGTTEIMKEIIGRSLPP